MSYFKDCNLPRAYIENSTRKTSLRASSSCSNFEKENIPTNNGKNKQYRIPQSPGQITGFEGRGVLGDMENRLTCFSKNVQIPEKMNTKPSNTNNRDDCSNYQLVREGIQMPSQQQSSQRQDCRLQQSEESFDSSSLSSSSSQRKKQIVDLSTENEILHSRLSEIMPILQRLLKNKQDDQTGRESQQQIQIQRESQRFSSIDNSKSQRAQRVAQEEFQERSIQENEKQANKLIQKQRSSSGIGIGTYSNEIQSKGQITSGKPPQKMKKEFEECMVLVESSRQKIHDLKSCLLVKEEEIRKLQDTVKDYASITERLLIEIEMMKENVNKQNQTIYDRNRRMEDKNKQIQQQNEEMVKQNEQLNRKIAMIMQQNEEMKRNVELQHQKDFESLKIKVKKLSNHVEECKTIWNEILIKTTDKTNGRINIINEQLLARIVELFGEEFSGFLQAILKDERDHKRLFGELEERLVGLEQSLSNNYIPQTKIQLRSLRKYIALKQGITQPDDLQTSELIALSELYPLEVPQQLQKHSFNGKQFHCLFDYFCHNKETELDSSQQMMINNNVFGAKNSEGLLQNSLAKTDGLIQNEDLLQMILIQANILQSAFSVQ